MTLCLEASAVPSASDNLSRAFCRLIGSAIEKERAKSQKAH